MDSFVRRQMSILSGRGMTHVGGFGFSARFFLAFTGSRAQSDLTAESCAVRDLRGAYSGGRDER